MKRIGRHAPSPAMIVALTALFVALGGTSYAALNLPYPRGAWARSS